MRLGPRSEVGPAEIAPAEVGIAEVGLAEGGWLSPVDPRRDRHCGGRLC